MERKNSASTFFFLIGLLSLPALGSFNYSYSKDISLLISSLIFIIIISMAAFIISSHLKKWLAIIVNMLIFLIIFSSEILNFISFYLQGEGFNERFFFHFTFGTIKSAWLSYPILTWGISFIMMLLAYFVMQISFQNPFKKIPVSVALLLILISPLLNSAISKYFKYQWDIFRSPIYSENWTEKNMKELGLDSNALKLQKNISALPGRNLVLIYLESLEAIYLDNNIFESLTPNMDALRRQGLFFSNVAPFPGTEWTIAGIVSSQCGTPLLYDSHVSGNDILASGFLDNVICLSDILHGAGYQQVYLGGATHKFAGKGEFLRNHHYDEVNGLDELLSSQQDQSYRTGWGLYDDTLFDIAANRFNELAMQDKPFNLTLLTLDTHHPTGNPSQSCAPYPLIDNSMLHAVHCTDQLLGDFLKKISQNSAFKNTVVVLLSDHLAMRNVAEKFYPKHGERRNTFLVINTDSQGEVSTTAHPMDIAPTILDLLGVEHNTNFLAGSSILKEKRDLVYDRLNNQTLAGIRHINSKMLSSYSNLCPNDTLIIKSLSNNSILVGNRKISLSYAGNAFDSAFFENNMNFKNQLSMIVFFNHLKKIEHTFIVEKYETPYLISKYGDLDYILINSDGTEVFIWFGRGNKLSAVDSFYSMDEIDIHLESCEEITAGDAFDWAPLSQALSYEHRCEDNNDSQYSAEYLVDHGILNLPSVRVYGYRYSFNLIKNSQEKFFLIDDFDIVSDELVPKYDPCMPAYFQDTLFIPQLKVGNKFFPVDLTLSTESSTKFLIRENQEALFK